MKDGCIIRMTDKQYLEKFVKRPDYDTFTRVIISQRIRLDKDYPDTIRLPKLFPPAYCVSMFIKEDGYTDEYLEAYQTYLNRDENLTLMAILVSSVMKTGGKLVLICTPDENDYAHLEILCDMIETIFYLECYSFKQFRKLDRVFIHNRAVVLDQLARVFEYLDGIEAQKQHEEAIERRRIRKDFEMQNWNYLYSFCKRRGIKAKKKYDKKRLIDNIMEADKKSSVILNGPLDDDEDDDDDEPRSYGKWPV